MMNKTIPQRVGALTSAVVATVTITGLAAESATAAPKPTPNPLCVKQVYVLGDSLTVPKRGGAGHYVGSYLKKRGVKTTTAYGMVGLPLRTVAKTTYKKTLHSTKGKRANTWIIALGTNDAAGTSFKNNVRKIMKIAGKKRNVAWVNTYATKGIHAKLSKQRNRVLAGEGKRYKNLTVIDFASAAAKKKQLFRGDGVHMTVAGYKWRAQQYANAVPRSCRG